MAVDPQRDVIQFLGSPSAHGGATVERIDTHSAIVFLAGRHALKLKRAVRFDYLDFSTPDLRHTACDAELRINRRTAPTIYRGVVAVTRESDGRLALDGSGVPLDFCVDMVRFDQEALLDRVAARGGLDLGVVERLADSVARFHLAAERRPDHGGTDGMRWVIEGNAAGFADFGRTLLPAATCADLTTAAQQELSRHGDLLDSRRMAGFVRQCHGDLHLRNIVLLGSQPTPFDAIEFNDEIACVDVVYDLAFLLMDLWRRGLRRHANLLLSRYLSQTGDFAGVALLPLFLSCRAAVRAKTSATSATLETDAARRGEFEGLAREYLAMAAAFLRPVPATLVAIGGRSGTGKSTLARALAPEVGRVPGAVLLRSDEIRKAQFGVSPIERLDSSGYTAAASDRVYRTLVDRARAGLQAGQSVVADAAFLRQSQRSAIEAAAPSTSGGFVGLWLDAPPAVLTTRVERRTADVSDADARVVQAQVISDVGQIRWDRVDASGDPQAVLTEARRRLGAVATGSLHDTVEPKTVPRSSTNSAASAHAAAQTPTARTV
jgi:uncharacterized protein